LIKNCKRYFFNFFFFNCTIQAW